MIGKSSSCQRCCWVNGCQRSCRSRSASSVGDIGIVSCKLAPVADETPRVCRVPRRRIEVLAAVVGAASLGAEIAAARLLAPWFGASTIVWANTIATVLVALSVGYWVGGRLADRDPTVAGLSRVVLCAAGLLALVPFVAGPFLRISVDALDHVQAGALVGSVLGSARLYVGTGNNYHAPTTDMADSMLALDAASGAILGHYQATPDDSFAADNLFAGPDYDFGASPNLFDGPNGEKLVGEGQKSGTYWALDRTTMKPVWDRSIGAGGYLGGIIGSTAFDGTRIYGADALDGHVFALARDGSKAWSSQDTGQTHFGPTMVAHGVLYTVDPSGFLIARDPASGTEITRLSLGAPAFGGASAVGGALYVSIGTGPPPEPAPQQDGSGSIVAFGDTSGAGAKPGAGPPPSPGSRAERLRLTVTPRRVRAGR